LAIADTHLEIEEIETLAPAESAPESDMPLPSDPRTIFLGGLFLLAALAAAYFASEILLPLMFAITLKLLLQPVMRLLERLKLPRIIAALLLIFILLGGIAMLVAAISAPASEWAARLPEGLSKLQQRLSYFRGPVDAILKMIHQIDGLGGGAPAQPSPLLSGSALFASVFSGARGFASALFTTILFLYFLLLSGDVFLRRLVEILPRFSAKRQAVDIAMQIEDDIFAYLSTITVMNLLVGLATAATMQWTGVGDPVLWGVVAFLLNFAPIIGPIIAFFVFLLAGLLTIDNEWRALAPAASYLVIHLIEGETLTPMLLAKRFTINPLLVVLSLVFWSWMWGMPGAILSAPMLAILKIICDRVRPFAALGHILEN
jgi:predicted PurR-regulated permease PerM